MVGIAVIGYGYWGTNLARNVDAASGAELQMIVDPDPRRRDNALASHPGVQTSSSMETALESPEIEAVLISTPASTHAELALRAMDGGCHVLVEKPLATSAADALAIAKKAKETGRVAMVGHTFLYSEPVLLIKRLIDEGQLGEIRYLAFQRRSLGRVRSDCDALWNFAPHDISIALYLLNGEIPTEVTASGLSFLQEGIDDVAFGTLRYEDGRGVNLQVSWLDPVKTRLLTVVGTDSMIVYDDVSTDRIVGIYDSGVVSPETGLGEFSSMGDFQWRTRAGEVRYPRIDLREPLLTEIEEFARACTDGGEVRTDAEHGGQVVRVLEALSASMLLRGAPVEVG